MEKTAALSVRKFEEKLAVSQGSHTEPLSAGIKSNEIQIDEITGGAVGVLYIPSFNNFSHLIARGVEPETLNNYVGMYESYPQIGDRGNCVLAAHSNILPGKQAYSYFNQIEDYVHINDLVNVLWNDGYIYQYKVAGIFAWIKKDDADQYLNFDTHNDQYLTLQTCTHGNSDYRTFIQCIRIK